LACDQSWNDVRREDATAGATAAAAAAARRVSIWMHPASFQLGLDRLLIEA